MMREIFDRAYDWLSYAFYFIKNVLALVVSPALSVLAFALFPIWIVPYLLAMRKAEVNSDE